MRKIKIGKNEIMTMPQLMVRYEELAVKTKNIGKQLDKIFKILNKLIKLRMKKEKR
ncbi:MAG: hypothetical protein Q8O59_00415 [bacterium]|nr:hypothetical protein [bacterium]